VRLHKDRRGRFLCTASSDLHRPKIEAAMLRESLVGMRHFSAPVIMDRIEELLTAGPEHGGYCHLLDLARAACEVRFDLFVRSQDDDTSRDPWRYAGWRDGLPVEMRVQWMRRSLERLAHRILDRRDGAVPTSIREIWVEVSLEMVLRRYEISLPHWQGRSQRAILEELLGTDTEPMTFAEHNGAVTYLVRRLRMQWGA
jgi:hypothetical protein